MSVLKLIVMIVLVLYRVLGLVITLEVLESVYIHVQHPDLCVQKGTVKPLLLVSSSTFVFGIFLLPSMCK